MLLHFMKMFIEQKKKENLFFYISNHWYKFIEAYFFSLGIFFATYFEGSATFLTSFMTGYMVNSLYRSLMKKYK